MPKIGDVKRFIIGLMPLLIVPSAFALEMNEIDLSQAFEVVFGPNGLGGILRSQWGVYGLTIIFYYLLFYNVYVSAMRQVKIFQGEGGTGLSKPGNMFSHAITGLTMLAIFAFKDASHTLIQNTLGPMGFFGVIVLSSVFYLMLYKNWKNGNMRSPGGAALAATGLLMLTLGELIELPLWAGIGFIMFFIGLIVWIAGFARGRGDVTARDERAYEGTEEAAERELGRDIRRGRNMEQETEDEQERLAGEMRRLRRELELIRQAAGNNQQMQAQTP